MDSRTILGFLNVQVWLTVHTFQLCHRPADYYNRKGWHSIILQGTVDNVGKFTNINIGWPGRVHDARVFVNSSLYQKGQGGTLFPDWKQISVAKLFHCWCSVILRTVSSHGC